MRHKVKSLVHVPIPAQLLVLVVDRDDEACDDHAEEDEHNNQFGTVVGADAAAGSLTPEISQSLMWLIFLRKFSFCLLRICVYSGRIYV